MREANRPWHTDERLNFQNGRDTAAHVSHWTNEVNPTSTIIVLLSDFLRHSVSLAVIGYVTCHMQAHWRHSKIVVMQNVTGNSRFVAFGVRYEDCPKAIIYIGNLFMKICPKVIFPDFSTFFSSRQNKFPIHLSISSPFFSCLSQTINFRLKQFLVNSFLEVVVKGWQIVWLSECQNFRMSECHNARMSKCLNFP